MDKMDWNKQIIKLEDDIYKLQVREKKIIEKRKELEEKLKEAKSQKANEDNKLLAEIVRDRLGNMDQKKIDDLKTILDMYAADFSDEQIFPEEKEEDKQNGEGEDN